MKTAIPYNTRVRILSLVGATFERDWSETGITRKPIASKGQGVPSPDWCIVQFDSGGCLCVHRDRLMICNDQGAA